MIEVGSGNAEVGMMNDERLECRTLGISNDERLECRMTNDECRMVEVAALGLIEKGVSAGD